jgi:glycosyltransferase involved in cell wall biosynthesis
LRILWLPHQDWCFVRRGQREYHLGLAIAGVHDVHFLTWAEVRKRPATILNSFRTGSWREDGFTIHQARRVPNVLGQRVHEKSGRGLRVNEYLYARAVRRLVATEGIDVVVCGISHQAVGLPPRDLRIPLVFDYLDYKLERWPDLENAYMARSDGVICTSQVLVERAKELHSHAYYLPNGVDLKAALEANGKRVRDQLELGPAHVVSLIGLTASTQLFYVDGMALAARDFPELVFLVVGEENELTRAMKERARQVGLRIVFTGFVPPSEVADFYAATDVGLYPGDKNPYFDAACPLKVLEYTAARKPVVATDLKELRNWRFPNVRLASPTPEAFAREVRLALTSRHEYPDLGAFEWSALGERLLTILDEVAQRGKGEG